jgi:hypothetical protein
MTIQIKKGSKEAGKSRGKGRGNRNRTSNCNPKRMQRHQAPPKATFAANFELLQITIVGLLQGDQQQDLTGQLIRFLSQSSN